MTLAQIDAILQGTFADPADRDYWEQKREEVARKEQNAAENQEYFDAMRIYDR